MNYWHLFYLLPAMLSLTVALRGLLPFELDDRLVPLYVALCCLVTLYLPVPVALALAAAWGVGLALRYFGVSLTGHEPFVYPAIRVPAWPRRTVEHVYKTAGPDEENTPAPPEEPVQPRKYIPEL